jgi:hypothetical protein
MSVPPTPLQYSYQDPDGNLWNLSDYTMSEGYICSAIAGIEGIPVMMQTIPLLDGTAVPNLYVPQPGSITLGLLVERPASDNPNDYYTLLDSVVRAFLTRRNELPAPGTLIIQRPDGTIRQTQVYTISGLDTPTVAVDDYTLYTLTLQTPNPYWTDGQTQTLVYSLNYAAGILPMLPIQLAGATVIGNNTVTNKGTALAYPTWTITGPGTPTITNNTTGLAWSMNTPIPAGQVVQVVTQRGQQSAYNITTATSVWDQLNYSSLRDLWPLVGGVNSITIAMVGASQNTSVVLSWQNQWSRA